jgi:hypothetical protein
MRIPSSAKAIRAILEPEVLFRAFLRKFPLGSLECRMALDAVERPWYAHGLYAAAELAKLLGEGATSAIEFGVAYGDGLVAMERLASEISERLKVQIHVFGFDSGVGLPIESDYRDLPCVWKKGLYKMDVAAVHGRLKSARLILGDVAETVPRFLEAGGFPPIGFIAFDLDYYTSTREALRIFNGPDSCYLPRVLSYFDDIMSGEQQYYCADVGELLAIQEFNSGATRNHRIRPINGWRRSFLLQPAWAEAVWAYHRFDHSRYNQYIGGSH